MARRLCNRHPRSGCIAASGRAPFLSPENSPTDTNPLGGAGNLPGSTTLLVRFGPRGLHHAPFLLGLFFVPKVRALTPVRRSPEKTPHATHPPLPAVGARRRARTLGRSPGNPCTVCCHHVPRTVTHPYARQTLAKCSAPRVNKLNCMMCSV